VVTKPAFSRQKKINRMRVVGRVTAKSKSTTNGKVASSMRRSQVSSFQARRASRVRLKDTKPTTKPMRAMISPMICRSSRKNPLIGSIFVVVAVAVGPVFWFVN